MLEKISCRISNPIKVQIKVGGKNDLMDIDTIYFAAPSVQQRDTTILLKKKFKEACFAIGTSVARDQAIKKPLEDDQEKAMMSKDDIIGVLQCAKDFDYIGFLKTFCSLMQAVAFKDEEYSQRLIASEIDKIEGDDLEDLMASYIENFFIGSWTKDQK